MKKILIIIALLLGFAGGICGIVAICICSPRQAGDFDYLGLLVGILSLLILFTVGWQIYTLIDTQKLRTDYEDLNRKLESQYSELDKKLQVNIKIISAKRYYDQGVLIGDLDPSIGIMSMIEALEEILESLEASEGKELYDIILKDLKSFIRNLKSYSDLIDRWEDFNEDTLKEIFNLFIRTKDQELINWYYGLQKEFYERSE